MNKSIITGSLGRDPEARFTASGMAVTSFSVAVNSGYGDKKRTDWLDVTCFNKTAELMGNSLHKGSKVLVSGRLQVDKWEKDGQKHSKPVIIADQIEFLDSKPKERELDPDENPLNEFIPKTGAEQFGKEVFPEEEIPF